MSQSARTRRRRQRSGPRNKLLLSLLVTLTGAGVVLAVLVGWVVSTAASAPRLSTLKPRSPGANTEILAADGTRLGFIQSNNLSLPVADSKVPTVLKRATVAIEDQRFYDHSGVDYEGIVRAAVKNFVSRKTLQGGSTITMQLVRNLYTGNKARQGLAGYKRKIREAKLADDLESEHSKEWILGRYLNTVPYGTVGGQTAIGVGAASRIYFGKPASKLTLREAALLAGLPQAPSAYSPFENPGAAKRRRNEVLAKMAQLRMITPERAQRTMAKGLGVNFHGYFRRRREDYVFDYVKDELIKEYGPKVALSGLKVHTTIDLDKQAAARNAIATRMGDVGPSAAVVTINPANGYIEAMASSGQYDKSQFNLAAQGHRQPGSSFKVMALMTALREGVDPDRTSYTSVSPTVFDSPQCGHVDVRTYEGVGGGRETLRQATLRSDNSVYIQLASDLGPDKIAQTAHDLGIRTKLNGYCAETLGGLKIGVSPLEMATAYATIADGGWRNRPTIITRVDFPDGHHELPARWRVHRVKAFPDGVTYEATKILEENIQGGTGTHAATVGCPAGGKTGTTDHNTDAWFVGFTPKLSTAVWVGYPNDRTSMDGLYHGYANVDGGTYPADIWGTYMSQARGSFCGSFALPKEPFQAQPFYGTFSRNGIHGESGSASTYPDDNGTTTAPTSPSAPTPAATPTATAAPGGGGTDGGTTGGDGTGTGNGGFDPDKYESPPQGPPDTVPPPDAGGTGGASPGQ